MAQFDYKRKLSAKLRQYLSLKFPIYFQYSVSFDMMSWNLFVICNLIVEIYSSFVCCYQLFFLYVYFKILHQSIKKQVTQNEVTFAGKVNFIALCQPVFFP